MTSKVDRVTCNSSQSMRERIKWKIAEDVITIIILATISGLVSNYVYMYYMNPDFKISLLNTSNENFHIDDTGSLEILVNSSRIKEYDHPVLLQTLELPKGISARIKPVIGMPTFRSNLLINISRYASIGENDITICGISSEGKNKYYKCKINILPRIYNISQKINLSANIRKVDNYYLITWKANGLNADNDTFYRFSLKSPSNPSGWFQATDWSKSDIFVLCTKDYPDSSISVKVESKKNNDIVEKEQKVVFN